MVLVSSPPSATLEQLPEMADRILDVSMPSAIAATVLAAPSQPR